MENIYLVTGTSENLRSVNEKIVAHDETEAIMQVQMEYGHGNYIAKLISGRLNG